MSKIMINNVALELDLLDADAMETYQKSLSDTMTALQEYSGVEPEFAGSFCNAVTVSAYRKICRSDFRRRYS